MAITHVLLDTHTLLWADVAPEKLSARARGLLLEPKTRVFVSTISAWEIGIKCALGKLPEAKALQKDFHQKLAQYDFLELAFTSADALCAAQLPASHKDLFDRTLAAQALTRKIAILSADASLDLLGASRIW